MLKMERASLQPLSQMGMGKGLDDLSGLSFSNPMCKHEGTELWTTFGSTLQAVCLPLHDLLVCSGGWRKRRKDETSPLLDTSGVSTLLLLLQDVDLFPFFGGQESDSCSGEGSHPLSH